MFIDLGISIATEIVRLVIYYEVHGFSSTHDERGSSHTPEYTHQNVQDFSYDFPFHKKEYPFLACCYVAHANRLSIHTPFSSAGKVIGPSSLDVVHPRYTLLGFSQPSSCFSLSSEEEDFMPAVAYNPRLVQEDVIVAADLSCRVCLACGVEPLS